MGLMRGTGPVVRSIEDGTDWSEAEIALFEAAAAVAAVAAGAVIGILRVLDLVIEAWPLPNSRPRK